MCPFDRSIPDRTKPRSRTHTQHFLRRGAGPKTCPLPQPPSATLNAHDRHAEARKPPVPPHVCPSSSGAERVTYDYIYANAMDAITAVRTPHVFVWFA